MSVRPLGSEELDNLYGNLLDRPRIVEGAGVSEAELREVLLTVRAANRAAYSITYGAEPRAEKLEFTGEVTKRLTDRDLFELLGNLAYNCVSNGGKLFLPREQWEDMNRLRLAVAWAHFEADGMVCATKQRTVKRMRR